MDNLQILTVEEHRKIHEETRRNNGKINGKINDKKNGKKTGKINGKKTGKKVLCIETGIVYESMHEACRQTNIDISSIGKVCNGKHKTAGGYHWRYVDEYGSN